METVELEGHVENQQPAPGRCSYVLTRGKRAKQMCMSRVCDDNPSLCWTHYKLIIAKNARQNVYRPPVSPEFVSAMQTEDVEQCSYPGYRWHDPTNEVRYDERCVERMEEEFDENAFKEIMFELRTRSQNPQ